MDLVCCVSGGGFKNYTRKMREYIGDIPIHSQLFSSSEGVLAAPAGLNTDDYILHPKTTFYEFIPGDNEDENPETLLLNELEPGKEYEIVITNKGGLYRYRTGDIVEIVGFEGEMPVIRFKRRQKQMVSLAGEKTNESHLNSVIKEIEDQTGNKINDFSIFADTETLPGRYIVLLEPDKHVPKSQRDEYRGATRS